MADQSPDSEDADMRRLRLSEDSPLIESLGQFLRELDIVHSSWLYATMDLAEAQERLFRSRSCVKELVDHGIVPPPGQTGTQFGAGLLNLVEEAWHLCRFVHSIPPDANLKEADGRRLLNQMRERLPAIHDELRKAWLHLKHVASLESGARDKTKRNSKKRPAHRPPDTDAKQDAKIREQWQAWQAKGNQRSIALFAQEFGYDEAETRAAFERVRSRRKKSVKQI